MFIPLLTQTPRRTVEKNKNNKEKKHAHKQRGILYRTYGIAFSSLEDEWKSSNQDLLFYNKFCFLDFYRSTFKSVGKQDSCLLRITSEPNGRDFVAPQMFSLRKWLKHAATTYQLSRASNKQKDLQRLIRVLLKANQFRPRNVVRVVILRA